jgi:hypothetical protein
VAPLAVGILIKQTGSYVPGFELGSIILLMGLLAYWFVVGDLTAVPASAEAQAD